MPFLSVFVISTTDIDDVTNDILIRGKADLEQSSLKNLKV